MTKTAMIDVGGGFRAIFGCGVMDRMLEDGIDVDMCYGVSAGAASGDGCPEYLDSEGMPVGLVSTEAFQPVLEEKRVPFAGGDERAYSDSRPDGRLSRLARCQCQARMSQPACSA